MVTLTVSTQSVDFDCGFRDDAPPFGDLASNVSCEFFRRVRDGLDSVPVQALEEIRPLDDRDGGGA